MIKDICLYRLKKSSKKVKPFNNYIVIEYVNSLMDKVNLNKILHSKNSYERFPVNKEHLETTGITFKYSSTIRHKITNYNKTVNNPDWTSTCVCDNYPAFIDEHHGHVLTGNLDIIEDTQTKNILEKGLNYRLKQPINKTKALSKFRRSINAFIEKISTTTKTPIIMFNTWKQYILELVATRLDEQTKEQSKNKQEHINLKYIKEFQKKFVITPVDKAAKNIGIICKQYYLEVLKQEITSNNFQTSTNNKDTVISDYSTLLQKNYNHTLSPIKHELPFIYWIPKFHKAPVGHRFITSGRFTVINALSKYIGIGLKHLLKIEKSQSNFTQKYNNIRNFYIIEDNKDIIEYMNNNNIFNNDNKYIKTFDFKTDIPYIELKDNIALFINSIFKIRHVT